MKNEWFYALSIFIAFIFALFVSIYSTIYFGSMEYMNLMMTFIFIVLVSFFLISSVYFFSEKKVLNSLISLLFFIGTIALIAYAFKAADTSNLTKYSIVYTIVVSAVSCFFLLVKRKQEAKKKGL